MDIQRKDFPLIINDNDERYLELLIGVIESVDELSSLLIIKSPTGLNFRLSPSVPKYNNFLIEEIVKLNNMFGIKLDMSKSIKTTGVLSFKIRL
jgi:hypothetical protein